ncbi:MAG: alpha-hydroxy-acid oxidizing protein [Myxococcales bacterium]|nr:alpha-hydroxy-acid oxidizing protein [Myxococcales bacterium]
MGMIETLRSVLRFRPFELDPVERRLARAASIEDLRGIAKRRLPRGVFDYIDGGAEDELTLERNTAGFRALEFRPRVLRDVSDIDPSATVLGKKLPIPLILAPTGFARMADPEGELAVARSAARAELPYTLSTLSTRSIEEVASAADRVAHSRAGTPLADRRRWFQVYVWKDRDLMKDLLARARESGYEAITITVDTAVLGRRERDVRRGFTIPPKIGLGTLIDGALHPGWTWAFVNAEPIRFANVVGKHSDDGSSAVSLADHMNSQFSQSLSWSDIEWFQEAWGGPVVLKGVQTVEDARTAASLGVEAVALSNHGGRQLDGAPPPIELVAPVADAVGGDVEIYCDGGVRRGSDIVKAVALGATACMAGRAHFYALAAAGERGVDWMLDFLEAGVRQTMALTGCKSLSDATRDLLRSRSSA